jgi:hypothetical protein
MRVQEECISLDGTAFAKVQHNNSGLESVHLVWRFMSGEE